jgi:hypothetical protein
MQYGILMGMIELQTDITAVDSRLSICRLTMGLSEPLRYGPYIPVII